MLDQETANILRTIHQRLPETSPLALKEILAADIPYPLKTFFRTDVEILLATESARIRKESRFKRDHPDVQPLQDQINSLLVMHYTFEIQEFHRRLEDAVHLIINYLVRPQWTLTGIAFEKERTLDVVALRNVLKYFAPYEYLRDLLVRYVQEKRIALIGQKEFSALLWKLDGEFVRRKSGDEMARILSPMFDFFDYPARTAANALPIRALVRYFEDKGLTSVIQRLEGEAAQGRGALTQHELGAILEDTRRTFGAFVVDKREEHMHDITQPVTSPAQPPIHTAQAEPQVPPPAEEKKGVPPLIVDEHDRRRFVRKIFKHDETSFDSSLRTLSEAQSWKQASTLIDEIFIRNDVDPYSSEAKRFTELISQRFFARV